jgi:integrase
MPKPPTLKPKLRSSRQRQGVAAWCVNVPPHLSSTGRRQQLFFASKTEATVVCEQLKARKDNFGVSLTALTPARIAEAAEAYNLLEGRNVSLLTALRRYLGVEDQRSASIPFRELCTLYIESRGDRRRRYLKSMRQTMNRFSTLHDRLVSDISHRDLELLLSEIVPGGRNLVMRHLRAFFNYGIKRGYLAENPISRLDFVESSSREVEVISPEDVAKMLETALANDLDLLPYLVLGFFCGIRPIGELTLLQWSDVDLQERSVTVRADYSKTKRRRFPDLSENAIAWLEAYRQHGGACEGPINTYSDRVLHIHRQQNRITAGVTHWPNSAMRHSYCSYWLAMHKDINKLVLQSGHTSVDTMWRHYHRGTTEAEAKKFWAIMPPSTANNIVRITA